MSRLSSDDWLTLVKIARLAISSAVLERSLPELPLQPPPLLERRGAFVSLYGTGRLRGCVGQIEDPGPLVDVVIRSAINAALHDGRFPPVGSEEIANLEIEISVLSVPERIPAESVVAGQHGLLVVQEPYRGVLLPQVAIDRKWSSQRLLEETCVKAGLARDAWRHSATQIFGFTAEIFSEKGQGALSKP